MRKLAVRLCLLAAAVLLLLLWPLCLIFAVVGSLVADEPFRANMHAAWVQLKIAATDWYSAMSDPFDEGQHHGW